MNTLCGSLEALAWESQFFGISSAMLSMSDGAPDLREEDLQVWQRVQAKIPADRADWLDSLQRSGFQLVEGEIDLAIAISKHAAAGAEIATNADIAELRPLAAQAFSQSRFRAPWYATQDNSRFYAQWIENAVKGTFDHECLVFRAAKEGIKAFVSLRQLNDREARIGLLAGRGMGEALMQAALHWTQARQFSILRMATQMCNRAALRRYIASGANIETTAYWLYR